MHPSLRHTYYYSQGGGGEAEEFTVSKVIVKYNDTDFPYLANKSGVQSGANFQDDANVIGVTTIVPDGTANSSLAYDQENDLLIVNKLDATGHLGFQFFKKSDIQTAMAAAIGTIPTPVKTIVGATSAQHGHTIDPTTQTLYSWVGSNILSYDSEGNLLATQPHDTGWTTPGSLSYNYVTGDMWMIDGTDTIKSPKRLRLVEGSWVTQETVWFDATQEIIYDPLNDGLIIKDGDGSGRLYYLSMKSDGSKATMCPYPFATDDFDDNTQNCVRDPRNGTFWLNADIQYHVPLAVNENTLWHLDPFKVYQKYLRFPDMHRFDLFKLTSKKSGEYNAQTLTGNDWDIGPVVDYASYTEQQSADNWTVEGGDADLEWRGSDNAPTTDAIDDFDNSNIKLYDANGANDGWGDTTPGEWQATPTEHRYMQHRQKAKAKTERWTPAALGNKLKLWFEMHKAGADANEGLGMFWNPKNQNRVEIIVNYVNKSISLSRSAQAQRGEYNLTNKELEMIAKRYQFGSSGISLVNSFDQVDVHAVFRRNATNQNLIIINLGVTGSDNNAFSLRHNGSNDATLANGVVIRHVDGDGNISVMGVIDTSIAHKLRTFRLGGATNQIFTNGVEETLSVPSGSNAGQTFADVPSPTNCTVGNAIGATTVNGNQHARMLLVTDHLTTEELAKLVTYCTEEGMI